MMNLKVEELKTKLNELDREIDKVFYGRNYAYVEITKDGRGYKYMVCVKNVSIDSYGKYNYPNTMGIKYFTVKDKKEAEKYLNELFYKWKCEKTLIANQYYNQLSNHVKFSKKSLDDKKVDITSWHDYYTAAKIIVDEDDRIWKELVNEYHKVKNQLELIEAA